MPLDWPLMHNNITRDDLDKLIEFLRGDPILTQSAQVRAFEAEWSRWLGVKHSVFVNSGASANFITLGVLKHLRGGGEVIVPPLTWISDVASVMHWGFTPVFVDIDPRTLAMSTDQVLARLSDRTRAVFLTHVQGFDGLTDRLLEELARRRVPLLEDVCESHGATHRGKKLGTFGLASNFSYYYYAHHMSTIEGGMVCTDDDEFHEAARMFRGHGMVRESTSEAERARWTSEHPDLNPSFIFAYPAFNMRNTELGAVMGRNQLPRLDRNVEKRNRLWRLFLDGLDPTKYRTDYQNEGCSNYALNLVLRKPDVALRDRVEDALRREKIEHRRGSAGGGNQLRQPYVKRALGAQDLSRFPEVDHVHFYGWYIGNYPDLPDEKVRALCALLNAL